MDIKKTINCYNCLFELSVSYENHAAISQIKCSQCSSLNYSSEYVRMDIGLSEVCNLSCNMCRRPQEKEFMSADIVYQAMIDGKKIGVSVISFSGGEPFVHPKLREIVAVGIDLGLQIELVTNGTLLKEKDLAWIEQLKCVTVSIDGPENVHDYIRGQEGAWKKTMDGVRLLAGSKAKWGINTVIQKANSNKLQETYSEIRKLGRPSYISFSFVEVIPETAHLMPNAEETQFAKMDIDKIREDCNLNFIHFNDPGFHGDRTAIFADKNRRFRPLNGCFIPRRFLGLSNYGIFPCWHQGRFIPDHNLLRALQTDLCKEIIQEAFDRKCIGCNAANYSWDQDWLEGVVAAFKIGDWQEGTTYLSHNERDLGALNSSGKTIPLVEREKKANR